jgi:hypothetical protein
MIEEKRNQKKEKRKLNTPVYTSLKHSHEIKHYMIKSLQSFIA